jgi:dihydrofolate synthase/folylpolyglutamate synthase
MQTGSASPPSMPSTSAMSTPATSMSASRGSAKKKPKTVLLFGALVDKEHEPMLACFDDVVDRRVYAVPDVPRAPKSAKVFTAIRDGVVAKSVHEGIAKAERLAGPDGLVVVGGSIFLVQEARAHVLGLRTDPSISM